MNHSPTAILICASILTACNSATPPDIGAPPVHDTQYPAGTVETSPGNYMIPLEEPVSDCKAYRHHAPGRMVAQVIYFLHPDGEFSPIREGAICE